jgi:hypothetical protein
MEGNPVVFVLIFFVSSYCNKRLLFVLLLEFLIKCQVLLILNCQSCQKLMEQKFMRELFSVKEFSKILGSSD